MPSACACMHLRIKCTIVKYCIGTAVADPCAPVAVWVRSVVRTTTGESLQVDEDDKSFFNEVLYTCII